MANPTRPSLRERFLGCLLGQAVGDALGAPFEGLTGETICRDFGAAADLVNSPPVGTLVYTDDTQMTISVAECLLERGRIGPDTLAATFARNYDPARCYGPGARRILDAMTAGEDWRTLVETIFPGGSLGNGAAMRVAPVGLLFHRDLDRVADEAKRSAQVTHLHPVGVDGAVIYATAVALAVSADRLDNEAFYAILRDCAATEEFRWQLGVAGRLGPDDVITFGSSLEAHRSVTSAILCFSFSPNSYADAVARAIGLGDDTDTLAGMAGALSGAFLGVSAIPPHLLKRFERGPAGRGYIEHLAGRLYERSAGL